MNPRIVSSIRKIYPKFGLAKDDIILATFPKSGTTWFRFILANIISLNELGGKHVDYKLLNEKLNGAIEPNWLPKIKYRSLPLIRSTHMLYIPSIFSSNKSIYLYRNPKDTMVSFYHYRTSFKKNEFKGDFKDFIRNPKWGLEMWCKHYTSWISNSTVSISYEELKNDTFIILKKVLDKFELYSVDDYILNEAIKRSDFKVIQNMENEKGRDKRSVRKHKNDFKFARKGKVNNGGYYFDEEDNNFFYETLVKYEIQSVFSKFV